MPWDGNDLENGILKSDLTENLFYLKSTICLLLIASWDVWSSGLTGFSPLILHPFLHFLMMLVVVFLNLIISIRGRARGDKGRVWIEGGLEVNSYTNNGTDLSI